MGRLEFMNLSWCFQLFDGKRTRLSVELGELADNIYSLGIFSNSREEPGTFQQREYEETKAPHQEGQATEGEKKISPTHVARTVAIDSRCAGEV